MVLHDMTCVSPRLIMQKLNIDPIVKKFVEERNEVRKIEVQQLLQIDILFKVKYSSHIVNAFIVKKKG